MALKDHILKLSLLLYVCCFLIRDIDCRLMTLNNKYLPTPSLKSIGLNTEEHLYSSPHKIVKRAEKSVLKNKPDTHISYGASSQRITQSQIIVDKSILEGTEKSNQAFVHWIGKEISEKVIVLTCQFNISAGVRFVIDSQLWRSDDYGSTFNKVNLGSGVKVSYFYTFPNNSQRLLFTDVQAKKIYTSKTDELNVIETHDVPVEPDIVVPSPYDENKILIYSLTSKKLYASHDFAQTWTLLSENVLQKFFWGTPGLDKLDTVHMQIESSTPDKAEYKTCISPDCIGVSSQMDNPGPFLTDSLIIYKEYMFVQKTSLDGLESYLMVSYKRQPFKMAHFPGNVKPKDFMLLNLDDGQLFVAVTHGDQVNLYLSDATGQYFVLSFADVYHVIHPYWLEIDLHEVRGMNWTFIVNKRVASAPNGARSFISFDKGGNWGPIPLTDDLKKQCKGEDCHLLLNVKQSLISNPVISSEHAPGIIVAHGTLAYSNAPLPSTVSVFTSRDGGWTWQKAPFDGVYHLNMLDQGSILTAFPDDLFSKAKSQYLRFSCDEGATWRTELYDNLGFMVNGVLTEPGILTLTESLFGHEASVKPWTLMKLNYSIVLREKCGEDDYESWFPKDFNDVTQNNCTMGQLIEFKRRKQNAKCHNGEELIPRVKSSYQCNCTREDYECDFGYEEQEQKQRRKCIKSNWYYEGYLPISCKQGVVYLKSQGYRKVSSDACTENEEDEKDYGKFNSTCSVVKPHGLSISTHSFNIPAGKEISLYLSQKGGSVLDTKYLWDFGDGSLSKTFKDFEKARHVTHTFAKSGKFKVKVKAQNSKGEVEASVNLHVQDRLSNLQMVTPLSGKAGLSVTMNVTVSSQLRTLEEKYEHVHFIWSFGDEDKGKRPELTWENSVTHTYKKKGTYTVTVEAVNSVGSVFKQFEMIIYGQAEILLLKFGASGILNINNPVISRLLLQRLRYQLSDDLGVGLDRITTILSPNSMTSALLYIYPSANSQDESIQSIKKQVLDLVNSGNFGFSLLGKRAEGGLIIRVSSAESYTPDIPDNGGDKHNRKGPNWKAIFIGVPVLVLVVAVCVFLLCYYRRQRRSAQQYSMLHIQDDSDALLDDEDDPPLDLNIEFRGRDSFRDDPVLDAGGGRSHLVLQDSVENC